ncbi:MAG: ABC transporter permease subunit, partial [Eubacteriales bacterium]|nr:ABC transporter permease subunit [Eubacteriales bacterium]
MCSQASPTLKNFARQKRIRALLLRAGILLLLYLSLWASSFVPSRLISGAPAMWELFWRILHPDFSQLDIVLIALWDTFKLALLASALGTCLAIPFVLLSARNISPNRYLANLLNLGFSFFRTLPSLVHAAILVSIFSVGKFSGLIALTIISILIAQKYLREALESLPSETLDSLKALGATQSQILLKSVLPQLHEDLYSCFFIILESNIRSASILGFVGAGGIGQVLWKDLNHLRYDRV